MPDNIQKWQLEGYIAVQLLCCLGWKLGGVKGWNTAKHSKFLSLITPTTHKLISGTIDRLSYEIHSNINRSVYEDLPLFCTMIPKEYRQDAWNNCKAILEASPHKMDQIIRTSLEKHLK